jgi:hypothetical protein
MPKKIIDVVRERIAVLKGSPVLATQNMAMAITAMREGIRSDAWLQYMTQFVEQNPPGNPVDPAQLARLTAKDGTLGDPIFDRQRAYLVANSICGPSTVETTDLGVDSIDFTLPNAGHVSRGGIQDCETTTVTGMPERKPSKRRAKKRPRK